MIDHLRHLPSVKYPPLCEFGVIHCLGTSVGTSEGRVSYTFAFGPLCIYLGTCSCAGLCAMCFCLNPAPSAQAPQRGGWGRRTSP